MRMSVCLSWFTSFVTLLLVAGAAWPQQQPDPAPEAASGTDLPRPEKVIARIGDYNLTASEFQQDVALRWGM